MHFSRYPACAFFLLWTVHAQNPKVMTLRGEVQGAVPIGTEVELQPCSGGKPTTLNGSINASGGFEVRDVEPGCYRVKVFTPMSGRSHYESIHEVNGGLQIRLKEDKPERPVSGPVSLAALRPKPTKKAMRAFGAASELSARGDAAGAETKLREALRLHPPFAEAHINLGAQLARQGRHTEAIESFEQARLLGIDAAALHANRAASLLELKRMPEALDAVRSALQLDPAYPQAHFLAGQITLRTNGALPDAERSFRSSLELPGSRIMLAQVLARRGQRAEARAVLSAYLDSGHAAYRPVALQLLQAFR